MKLIDGSERKGNAQEPESYTVYLHSYLPLTFFFIIDACLSYILESTKGVEIKLGTNINVNKRICRRQTP